MSTQKRKKRSSSLKGTLNPSKRHRDRFNIELDNLAKLLPFPHDVIQKLDKLSILRLSASYLRAKNFFKGQQWAEESQVGKLTDGHAEFEGNGVFSKLLLDALDGFVIVLTRDFEVFYASETVQDYLGLAQASVIHQDFLRFIHVDDHELIRKNLQPFPEEEEQKIRILDDENDGTVSESGSTCSGEEHSEGSDDVETERSFVCRMKCILNTSAGFFKPFRCSGRLRELTLPDSERREYGLFMICTPLETVSSSMLEIRLKTSLFCTKNRMDLSFMDIDQKGRSLLGYHKRDIALQSSYCMIHFDDITVLQTLHSDLMNTGKCQGSFRMLNKNLKWQWLTGTAQVVFKGNEPDFIITTNRPLSDEEGEEILRQRGQFPPLPFTVSECGSPSPRSPRSPHSAYSNGGIPPHAFPYDNFSATGGNNFKTHASNGRVNKKKPRHISEGIAKSPGSDLTINDLPPIDPIQNVDDVSSHLSLLTVDPSSVSLLTVDPPTYEEAILLAAGLTSPEGSHMSLSHTPPRGNLEHFSPKPPTPASPYSSTGHPASHMSPGCLPTPDPSPIGNCNPSTASVNISWGGEGQMKVSNQPQQLCASQQAPYPMQPYPSVSPSQGLSKSAHIAAHTCATKKMEKEDTMYGSSCRTGQSPNPMTSPRGMPQHMPSTWTQQRHMQQQPMPPRDFSPQGYGWKAPQQMHLPVQNFPTQGVNAVIGNENPVYATNMQGRNWDPVPVPPPFEEMVPPLGCENRNMGYMRTGQNFGGHLQQHNMDPSILSPPYQDDFPLGFGFQGNSLPAVSTEQTPLAPF